MRNRLEKAHINIYAGSMAGAVETLQRVIAGLLSRALDTPLSPPTTTEVRLLTELKGRFTGLSFPKEDDLPPSQAEWVRNMRRLQTLVLSDDPREFLRWDVVRHSMFVTHPRFVQLELDYLKQRPDWGTRWRAAIKESTQGHPLPYPFHPASSGNVIHNAYHLAQFEERTNKRVHRMQCVLEFGGGYGCMCALCHRLGFTGKYLVFDLPAFSALQEYYLKSIGMSVHESHALESEASGVSCISDYEDLKATMLALPSKYDRMFISTWAVSEAPLWSRNAFLPLVSLFDAFLIAYQRQFGEMDNVEFFLRWREQFRDQIAWQDWPIEHIRGNNYLIGERTGTDRSFRA
ncbi:MAG: hypothetical protein ACHQ9S_24325 [Candidatus Binatia bacterium]